ncbi:polyprenyl synthetase family protein [Jannaschia aquimarina]|uniref:IspB_2 protein n=1 Tax=Jannaschia aquimarina TaxID=935700 RepID=A0A0D1EHB6_9RHOB|nr:polyprenyl synthetase family protein [Jannaschia aquimarina]KIT15225.1 Octaprenyl-diphosphate synthase [Jannaschia aquimarina]SNT32655.1 Geranylgeranyl pyrophosphate synthase [Jannaschia aquimarina]
MNSAASIDATSASVIDTLGFSDEMTELRERIADWVATCDDEMRDALEWQFLGGSKYFRPLTIFACHRATHGPGPIPPQIMTSALVIEFFHNVSLVIDDIVDRSPERRGRATMHTRFGELSALMTSGYIVAEGYLQLGDDLQAITLFSELLKRLGVAECMQWRLRRQPLGYEDWWRIAGEDTGSMFEICACLGDRSGRLRTFGGLLGRLYHGCDDVADVRGLPALGGGGKEDLRDGILTLPASIAITDPDISVAFCRADPSDEDLDLTAAAFTEALPAAEARLDEIAEQAREEAQLFAKAPEMLDPLILQTRALSGR